MTLDDAVKTAAEDAALVLAERGKVGFYGSVVTNYKAGRIVSVEVTEKIHKT